MLARQGPIMVAILKERERQDAKWGFPQGRSLMEWMSILGEEYGEACQAANKLNFGGGWQEERRQHFREEVVQVAAVAVAILEELELGTVSI